MARTISNGDKIIDSRDIIKRVRELEDERADMAQDVEDAQEAFDNSDDTDDKDQLEADIDTAKQALSEWDDDNGSELKALKDMDDEAPGDDWAHGATLIREDYFVEYCKDLVSDIGDLPRDIPSYLEIDWDKTADNLRADYSEVDYDGETYLVR